MLTIKILFYWTVFEDINSINEIVNMPAKKKVWKYSYYSYSVLVSSKRAFKVSLEFLVVVVICFDVYINQKKKQDRLKAM